MQLHIKPPGPLACFQPPTVACAPEPDLICLPGLWLFGVRAGAVKYTLGAWDREQRS